MSFKNILGHERPKEVLANSLRQGRIAPAYLFTGEEGIGKRLMAQAFAAALNCEGTSREDVHDACGLCSSCSKIRKDIHPDVTTIVPDSAVLKVEQIRDLQKTIIYTPYEGKRKVYLVDQADKMNLEAANCFLKTLEEPPERSTIILITSKPEALPITIRSRCLTVSFHPLSRSDVEKVLIRDRGLSPSDARLLASLSSGRIGQALERDPQEEREARDAVLRLLSPSSWHPTHSLFQTAKEFSESREMTETTLSSLSFYLRDILVLKKGGDHASLINEDRLPDLSQWGEKIAEEDLMDLIGLLHTLWKAERYNMNRQLALEVLLLRLRESVKC